MAFECAKEFAVPKCKEPRSEPSNLCDEHLVPATVFAHGKSTGVATEQDVTLISPTDDATVSTALVLTDKPSGAVDELATCVASFLTEYNYLDSEISDLTDDLLAQERKLAGRYRDELLPMINQMQMLLSQRGALHALVSSDRSMVSALAQLEDVPTWTDWYEAFASRVSEARSLRTVQRQLKKLRGKTESATDADDDGDTDTPSALGGFDARDEVMTGAELLAEHIKQMIKVLAGKSIMSDAMRITRASSLAKDLQRALEEGFLFAAPPVAEPEKVAAAPDKPDPFVSKLNAEPDWKQVLVELIAVLEQYGDRLPLAVLSKKRTIEKLLEGKDLPLAAREVPQHPAKRYQKPKKVDSEGNRCCAVKANGEKKALETFEVESDADKAVANLSLPVVPLSDIGAASTMLSASVTLEGAECMDLHEGVA